MKGHKGYISLKLFTKIVDEMAQRESIALIPFFRGESLLHPEFMAMMAYAKERRIEPIQLATNATLLTKDVARGLLDLELDFVSFSIDSINPQVYKEVRSGADLMAVLRSIESFCDLRERRKVSKPNIQVSVVRTRRTADEIESFVDYWRNRVDRVRIYEEHSQDGRFGSLHKDRSKTGLEERQPCMKPFTDMVICWDGSVALCNHDWNRKAALGNLEENSIEEIWHSQAYKTIRKAHLGKSELERLCEECDHWKAFYDEDNFIGELYLQDPQVTGRVRSEDPHNSSLSVRG